MANWDSATFSKMKALRKDLTHDSIYSKKYFNQIKRYKKTSISKIRVKIMTCKVSLDKEIDYIYPTEDEGM